MSRRAGPSVLILAAAIACVLAGRPANADDHHREDHHDNGRPAVHHDERRFPGGPSFGLFFGAPAVVAPPPVVYAPAYPYSAYPYAPTPISGVYLTAYGYCRDYRTAAGIETACQQPDGIWRFVN